MKLQSTGMHLQFICLMLLRRCKRKLGIEKLSMWN
jgi:hypothetical protein